jgi:hypothetical protein
MLSVAVSRVRLELKVDQGVNVDVVSDYWSRPASPDGLKWSIDVGALPAGDERHVVVRLGFPPVNGRRSCSIHARLMWESKGVEHSTVWQEVTFTYASHHECSAEPRDAGVMHWVGLHQSYRAQPEATMRSRKGDLGGAGKTLRRVARHMASYASGDGELLASLEALKSMEHVVADQEVSPMMAKEYHFQSQRLSRGQKDMRGPQGDTNP